VNLNPLKINSIFSVTAKLFFALTMKPEKRGAKITDLNYWTPGRWAICYGQLPS
jgi:hypothetical protein